VIVFKNRNVPMSTSDEIRDFVAKRIESLDLNMREVSLKIGAAHTYIDHYLHRKTPKYPTEKYRARLANVLKIDERELIPDDIKKSVSELPDASPSPTPLDSATVTAVVQATRQALADLGRRNADDATFDAILTIATQYCDQSAADMVKNVRAAASGYFAGHAAAQAIVSKEKQNKTP
jgi:transcriptional regulator with XRE-family HTH domain